MCFGAVEDDFVNFAVGIFREHGPEGAVGPHWAPAMADGKESARETILVFHEVFWPLHELASGGTGPQHFSEIGIAKDVAEKALGVAGHPAIALGDGAFGIYGNELVGAVLFPYTRQPGGCASEVMNECIEWAESDAVGVAAFHPDIEQAPEKCGERRFVEVEIRFHLLGWPARKWRIHLETREPQFLSVVTVKSVRPGIEAALMQHGDDAYVEPGSLGFLEPLRPDFGVSFRASFEKFPMEIGVVHRGAQRTAEHRVQDIIPRGRIADEIRLEIMLEAATACGGCGVHEFACFHEPCRPHDHGFAALPVDLAFLYALVLHVVEELTSEERHQQHGKAVRLLVLEAVGAGHIALRSGQEDDTEAALTHDS